MCGIAGYSLSASSDVDRTLAAQALLAGIAERGADAVGYAYRCGSSPVAIHKQRSGASALLEQVVVPSSTTEALIHVRDYTKGHPRIEANNHPIRHGSVVGVHNGIIFNDDELMAEHGFERAEPEMTVDSEAIFALAEAHKGRPQALEQLRGSMATAWLDGRRSGTLFLARGVGRPLWVGTGRQETLFASTKAAIEVAERFLRLKLRKRELAEGTLAVIGEGQLLDTMRFKPDRNFEERSLPAVRAPQEGAFCLQRLAALASL
ncbi:MAG: amidophosphoribosyltransferase [Gaiellaceae bacterium]|jgi:glucosamine 6-phosphate synthetase-like amidotransferase/phosphosugar isomerase protein|nr:amidophosphoribosyltransferase [Gaiellaceae bacterium]MDX6505602.1 amidophosphoribosyltransferase [Gaiellaceae bacterium]